MLPQETQITLTLKLSRSPPGHCPGPTGRLIVPPDPQLQYAMINCICFIYGTKTFLACDPYGTAIFFYTFSIRDKDFFCSTTWQISGPVPTINTERSLRPTKRGFTLPLTTSKLKRNQNECTHRLILVKFSVFKILLCQFKLIAEINKVDKI